MRSGAEAARSSPRPVLKLLLFPLDYAHFGAAPLALNGAVSSSAWVGQLRRGAIGIGLRAILYRLVDRCRGDDQLFPSRGEIIAPLRIIIREVSAYGNGLIRTEHRLQRRDLLLNLIGVSKRATGQIHELKVARWHRGYALLKPLKALFENGAVFHIVREHVT